MAYFSEHNELGYFGCGADCSCKACRGTTASLSQVYEEEEPPQAAQVNPPVVSKMAGWFGRPTHLPARGFLAYKPYALGEGFELGIVKFSKRFTSRDYMWSDPITSTTFVARRPFVGGLRVERKLKIRFSEDWLTFQARFKKAIERLSSPQMVASHLEGLGLDNVQRLLHAPMVADKANAKDFVVLDARMFYLKQPSGNWILNNFDFGQDNIDPPTWQWE